MYVISFSWRPFGWRLRHVPPAQKTSSHPISSKSIPPRGLTSYLASLPSLLFRCPSLDFLGHIQSLYISQETPVLYQLPQDPQRKLQLTTDYPLYPPVFHLEVEMTA